MRRDEVIHSNTKRVPRQSPGEHPVRVGDTGGLPGDRLAQVRGAGYEMGRDRGGTSSEVRLSNLIGNYLNPYSTVLYCTVLSLISGCFKDCGEAGDVHQTLRLYDGQTTGHSSGPISHNLSQQLLASPSSGPGSLLQPHSQAVRQNHQEDRGCSAQLR